MLFRAAPLCNHVGDNDGMVDKMLGALFEMEREPCPDCFIGLCFGLTTIVVSAPILVLNPF